MSVTVYLIDGGVLNVADFGAESALDMLAEFKEGEGRTMTFDMDGATVVVARQHVVRIDLEPGDNA